MIRKIVAAMANLAEKLLLRIPVGTSYPIIFISGAPRSGSTITYQYFVELGRFCFFTNLDRRNYRFPVVSALLYRGCGKYRPTDENSYGHVPGRYSPSDGWEIFHRWFPYYYDPENPVKSGASVELYRTIAWFQKIYKRPFIVKNNANSLRIKELKRIFPDAVFVHVERNREETIKSITEGMIRNNVTKDGLWGTGPKPQTLPKDIKSVEEKACYQINFIQSYVASLDGVITLRFERNNVADLRRRIQQIVESL
jgi:hypothetical protein